MVLRYYNLCEVCMKIVVLKSPKLLSKILEKVLKIKDK